MSVDSPRDTRFTAREWRHILGINVGGLLACITIILLGSMQFCPDPLGDAVLAGLAVIASLASFFVGWRNDPECSDEINLLILLAYPVVPLFTVSIVCLWYW